MTGATLVGKLVPVMVRSPPPATALGVTDEMRGVVVVALASTFTLAQVRTTLPKAARNVYVPLAVPAGTVPENVAGAEHLTR